MNRDKKQIQKIYAKALKKASKRSLEDSECSKDYFILYLKYLRDIKILEDSALTLEENAQVITLGAAISAYFSYIDCINKYYNITRTAIERKNKELSEEETQKKYSEEKMFYFNSFWEIVQNNFESWIL